MEPRHGVGCGCRGVDVHAHMVPENFPAYVGSSMPADWPSMAPGADCHHRQVMIAGRNYRTVSDHCWSATRRLEDFDAMGLTLQVVSPMPELLSYWMPAGPARQLVRFLNEEVAAMVAQSQGRMAGFGAVPLQDMDAALAELHYLHGTLRLQGVEIGSNVNGVPVGDPRLLPFFEACVALDLPVFVHALRPAGMDRLVGPPPLQQVLAYPTDVGLAAASVITGNLMARLPGLRIAFSHGGGTLSMLLPRLQQSVGVFPALREGLQGDPVQVARSLYYDTLVFDEATLRHLVATLGASQLMLGTDYPFNFHERRPVDRVMALGLEPALAAQLVEGNARCFLGIAP